MDRVAKAVLILAGTFILAVAIAALLLLVFP